MSYQALYRKFRPETFQDVKGQDAIITTLKNQIKSGRIGHAYLFTGTRGTGKTTVAKIFAKAVNCETPAEDGSPCGNCAVCKGISDGSLMNVAEIDAASNNGVDNIRSIINEVSYSPTMGKYKVYIIDEAHMLSAGNGGAFNALLKTLEEPPAYVIFILATTEVNKVPVTILSRCQRYDFHRMSIDTMADRMKELVQIEGAEAEDRALRFIARTADGSMRDALSLLDQCLAFHFGQALTYDMALDVLGAVDSGVYISFMEKILKQDLSGAIGILDDQIMRGREISAFINDFIWHMRNMLLLNSADSSEADIADVLGVSTDTLEQLKSLSKKVDADSLMRFIRIFSELSGEIRYTPQKRVLTEIAIVKLMRPQMEEDLSSVKQRLAQIERKVNKMEADSAKVLQNAAGIAAATRAVPAKPDAPVPDALPEDVQLVVSNWKRIIKNANPVLKGFLELTEPSTDGKRLIIKCMNDVAAGTLKEDFDRDLLDEVFAKELHKKVEYEIYTPSKNEGMNETYPDLSSFINDEIEIVESPDEEST